MAALRTMRSAMHVACALTLGCADGSLQPRAADAPAPAAVSSEPGPPEFCARPGDDAVRDIFCTTEPPTIDSLAALKSQLRFASGYSADHASAAGYYALPVLLGLSTALNGHLVSPINPRAIMVGPNVFMAFQRGVQEVELAARTRARPADVRFYLLRFEQACNAHGCDNVQRFTPYIESNWTRVTIQDDEELKNTPSDCRQCHQRGSAAPSLLMRELQDPWTHFFDGAMATDPGMPLPGVRGHDLMLDYLAARSGEHYAGIDPTRYAGASGLALQVMVERRQPLFFDAKQIEDERWPHGPDGYPAEPLPSPTWQRAYDAWKSGEQLPLPHYDARPTDPVKQAELSAAYARWQTGQTDQLPDLSDIFPDDPQTRAEIGLQTEPNASPEDALIQACGSCHNHVLDQSLSRARFSIALSGMDRAELEQAIARIQLPRDAAGAMPPVRARQLDPTARERLLSYLRDALRTPPDSTRLTQAADMGMMGGAGPIER